MNTIVCTRTISSSRSNNWKPITNNYQLPPASHSDCAVIFSLAGPLSGTEPLCQVCLSSGRLLETCLIFDTPCAVLYPGQHLHRTQFPTFSSVTTDCRDPPAPGFENQGWWGETFTRASLKDLGVVFQHIDKYKLGSCFFLRRDLLFLSTVRPVDLRPLVYLIFNTIHGSPPSLFCLLRPVACLTAPATTRPVLD